MANEPRFEIFPFDVVEGSTAPQWGWRFRDSNGRIIASGAEGYTRAQDASRAVEDFLHDMERPTGIIRV